MKVYVLHEQFTKTDGSEELYVAVYAQYYGAARAIETIINDGEMLSRWQSNNVCHAVDAEGNHFTWQILEEEVIDDIESVSF